MKPKFTKPFNVEHAKAGAPYCMLNGDEVTILKYDGRRPGFPLIAIYGKEDHRIDVSLNGDISTCDAKFSLAMVQLAMVDGKPVFVGDELLYDDGSKFSVEPHHSGCSSEFWNSVRWTVKREPYPETTMSFSKLRDEFNVCSNGAGLDGFRLVANAAIRLAIKEKQVVTAAEFQAMQSNLGHAYIEQYAKINNGWLEKNKERDLYIAQEMRRNFGMKPEVIQEILKQIK